MLALELGGEQRDLVKAEPEKAKLLLERLRGWRQEVDAQMPAVKAGKE